MISLNQNWCSPESISVYAYISKASFNNVDLCCSAVLDVQHYTGCIKRQLLILVRKEALTLLYIASLVYLHSRKRRKRWWELHTLCWPHCAGKIELQPGAKRSAGVVKKINDVSVALIYVCIFRLFEIDHWSMKTFICYIILYCLPYVYCCLLVSCSQCCLCVERSAAFWTRSLTAIHSKFHSTVTRPRRAPQQSLSRTMKKRVSLTQLTNDI